MLLRCRVSRMECAMKDDKGCNIILRDLTDRRGKQVRLFKMEEKRKSEKSINPRLYVTSRMRRTDNGQSGPARSQEKDGSVKKSEETLSYTNSAGLNTKRRRDTLRTHYWEHKTSIHTHKQEDTRSSIYTHYYVWTNDVDWIDSSAIINNCDNTIHTRRRRRRMEETAKA